MRFHVVEMFQSNFSFGRHDLHYSWSSKASLLLLLKGLGSPQLTHPCCLATQLAAPGWLLNDINYSYYHYRPAAGQAWRNEAGAYIRSFETLNRSQQEAVAKAILRRFTLWQVRNM